MSRRHITFDCEGSALAGSLDLAAGTAGLLLVSGGNELRSGAWAGQAKLAAQVAGAGFPVFRFDRRGIGDSEGANGHFRASGPDIAAALAAFRAQCPQLTRIVGMGNCDAASALMLAGGAACHALLLSNPWTIEQDDAAPPPDALRSHYRSRLADPAAIMRLLTGKISLRRLIASLLGTLKPAPPPSSLARDMKHGIAAFAGDLRFLIAEHDRTAQAFLSAWDKADPRVRGCPGASHSYVEPDARAWLLDQVLDLLRDNAIPK